MRASLLVALLASPANAQFFDPNGPRARREERDRVVRQVGEEARRLVEEHEWGAKALLACSRPTAKQFANWYSRSGELNALPNPEWALAIIADPRCGGDDTARFVMGHAGTLRDPDAFAAFTSAPLEYALRLRSLARGAADVRAERLRTAPWTDPDVQQWGATAAAVLALVLLVRRVVRARRARVRVLKVTPNPPTQDANGAWVCEVEP